MENPVKVKKYLVAITYFSTSENRKKEVGRFFDFEENARKAIERFAIANARKNGYFSQGEYVFARLIQMDGWKEQKMTYRAGILVR